MTGRSTTYAKEAGVRRSRRYWEERRMLALYPQLVEALRLAHDNHAFSGQHCTSENCSAKAALDAAAILASETPR